MSWIFVAMKMYNSHLVHPTWFTPAFKHRASRRFHCNVTCARRYNIYSVTCIWTYNIWWCWIHGVKPQLHDAIYRLRFYSNLLTNILSLSNLHNNLVSIQNNRGDKSHSVIVALAHCCLLLFYVRVHCCKTWCCAWTNLPPVTFQMSDLN